MSLIASIYRNSSGEFSNGGISAFHTEVTIVNCSGSFSATKERPPVLLMKGARKGYVKCVPAVEAENGEYEPVEGWSMFGGCYVGCSYSRFTEKVKELGADHGSIVAFHDRFESYADQRGYF